MMIYIIAFVMGKMLYVCGGGVVVGYHTKVTGPDHAVYVRNRVE